MLARMGGSDLLCVRLNYAQDEGPGKAPYLYTAPLTKAQQEATGRKEQSCGKTVEIDVTVRDGRNYQHSLDKHSFQLVEQETALTIEDFFKDQEKVRSVYYPEIAELIKKSTGAAHVLMFHHQLRAKNNQSYNHWVFPENPKSVQVVVNIVKISAPEFTRNIVNISYWNKQIIHG